MRRETRRWRVVTGIIVAGGLAALAQSPAMPPVQPAAPVSTSVPQTPAQAAILSGGRRIAGWQRDTSGRWKAQTGNGRMLIKTGDGHDLPIPFSFRGFAQAMDGLAKTAP